VVVDAGIRQDDREEVTVHPSVTAALPEIAALCERLGVSRLDLFGSATGPEFDEQTSDVDVVVEFGPSALSHYFDTYFALKEGLHQVLGRPVDVVVAASVRNPYFLRQLRSEAEPLYAA
jgi:predicted nucleotidyltransferase